MDLPVVILFDDLSNVLQYKFVFGVYLGINETITGIRSTAEGGRSLH